MRKSWQVRTRIGKQYVIAAIAQRGIRNYELMAIDWLTDWLTVLWMRMAIGPKVSVWSACAAVVGSVPASRSGSFTPGSVAPQQAHRIAPAPLLECSTATALRRTDCTAMLCSQTAQASGKKTRRGKRQEGRQTRRQRDTDIDRQRQTDRETAWAALQLLIPPLFPFCFSPLSLAHFTLSSIPSSSAFFFNEKLHNFVFHSIPNVCFSSFLPT